MAGLLSRLFQNRDPSADAGRSLCDQVIHKARSPEIYQTGLAPDTFEGRFAATSLYGGLLMRRLRDAGPDGARVSNHLSEALFDRFDYALREEGVGDATIARKVRKLGEEFFGLAKALDGVLSTETPSTAAVSDVLVRNGLGGPDAGRWSHHVLDVVARLEAQDDDVLLDGRVEWD